MPVHSFGKGSAPLSETWTYSVQQRSAGSDPTHQGHLHPALTFEFSLVFKGWGSWLGMEVPSGQVGESGVYHAVWQN